MRLLSGFLSRSGFSCGSCLGFGDGCLGCLYLASYGFLLCLDGVNFGLLGKLGCALGLFGCLRIALGLLGGFGRLDSCLALGPLCRLACCHGFLGGTELVGEALDASTGIDELLLTGEERVALVAEVDPQLGLG